MSYGWMPPHSLTQFGLSLLIRRVGIRSIVNRIISKGKAPIPPEAIFGTEPSHDWCFYYQKASLARQKGEWGEIGRLHEETVAQKLGASDKSEVFPFLEGLVNLGRYDDAKALYESKIKEQVNLNYGLCESLTKDTGYSVEFNYDYTRLPQILCEP